MSRIIFRCGIQICREEKAQTPRKFESFELCIRIKRYVSFQWKSHGTKLNMKRRQTAACMFTRMSKIRGVIIYKILLVFTSLEVCLCRMMTHSKGVAPAKTTIGSPVSTDLSPAPRVTKPYYEESVLIEGCESVWIWNSIANFQKYVSCLFIFKKINVNYLNTVHLLSFVRFLIQLAILVPTSEKYRYRHSHLFILLGSTLSYGNGAFHRRDKERLHDTPASLQVRK